MEKVIQFLVVTQDDAYKVVDTLKNLNDADEISVAEMYVLEKDNNGKVSLKDSKGNFASNTVFGAFAGGLMGLLAGPAGFLLGITYGTLFGSIGDLANKDSQQDYLDQIGDQMPNGKSMVIAHVYEEWMAPIDSQISSYAEIKRIDVDEEIDKAFQEDIDALDKEIADAKDNMDKAVAEDKAQFQQKLDELAAKRIAKTNELKSKVAMQKQAYKNWYQKAKKKIKSLVS